MHLSAAGPSSVLCEVRTEISTPLSKGLNSLNRKALPRRSLFLNIYQTQFVAKFAFVFTVTLFTHLQHDHSQFGQR